MHKIAQLFREKSIISGQKSLSENGKSALQRVAEWKIEFSKRNTFLLKTNSICRTGFSRFSNCFINFVFIYLDMRIYISTRLIELSRQRNFFIQVSFSRKSASFSVEIVQLVGFYSSRTSEHSAEIIATNCTRYRASVRQLLRSLLLLKHESHRSRILLYRNHPSSVHHPRVIDNARSRWLARARNYRRRNPNDGYRRK